MKKILTWMLALIASVCFFSVSAKAESYVAGGDCGDDLKWSLDYDGTLFIYGEGEMNRYKASWRHEYGDKIKTVMFEKGATTISEDAFSGCKNLKKVTLPSTMKRIDDYAFLGCTSLESINLPEGLTSLGMAAFVNCTSLSKIQFPSTLEELPWEGFRGSGLVTVSIPSEIKKIRIECFMDCPKLTTAVINGSNLEIPMSAFAGCTMLNTVKMGNGVTKIGTCAFNGCTMLRNLTIGNNVRAIDNTAFRGCTALKEVSIPDRVEEIDGGWPNAGAFSNCTSLEKLTLGIGVSKIGATAFENCTSLREVYFCGSAPKFDDWKPIFSGCKSFTAYYPSGDKTWDRSKLTNHGAERVEWKNWTVPLDYFTPVLKSLNPAAKGIKVSWNQLNGVKGYEIWRQSGNGSFTKVKTITSPSTLSWTDTSVANGKRYTYRIYGKNGTQLSKVSNAKYMYFLSQNTASLSKSGSYIVVKWKKNSQATGYQIQYSKKSNFSNAKLLGAKGASKTSGKIKPGKGKFYIRVRTYKKVNGVNSYSAWSSVKTITV
ncbi:MAG: leucine-rich repeat domain-containing protein [Eubacteriales bacterium]|nr:leucine-rich repeat domain-containing protein [Eubacteriales bacterium]